MSKSKNAFELCLLKGCFISQLMFFFNKKPAFLYALSMKKRKSILQYLY